MNDAIASSYLDELVKLKRLILTKPKNVDELREEYEFMRKEFNQQCGYSIKDINAAVKLYL